MTFSKKENNCKSSLRHWEDCANAAKQGKEAWSVRRNGELSPPAGERKGLKRLSTGERIIAPTCVVVAKGARAGLELLEGVCEEGVDVSLLMRGGERYGVEKEGMEGVGEFEEG